jgi:two-component system, sensor histidine kinase and response regulator
MGSPERRRGISLHGLPMIEPLASSGPDAAAAGQAAAVSSEEAHGTLLRLRLAAWLLLALIAVLLPVMHLWKDLEHLRDTQRTEARQLANSLSRHASRDPNLWLYKLNALVSELESVRLRGATQAIRLSDVKGNELATVGTWVGRLSLDEFVMVMDSGAAVARLELQADAATVLVHAIPAISATVLVALLTWWLLFKTAVDGVAALILRLQRARDDAADARAASRAKSQFLATMSHEIRTPMNGVLGMNELLLGSPLNPLQTGWAQAVQASGQHLLGVINDILDFSKIESGHLELEEVEFSVDDAVEKALAMFAQPAEAKGLELALQFTPHDAPFAVRGDPLRLRQVLANLIGNAVKFTDEGEVVVRVDCIEQTDRELALRISVQDTGIGIAPQAQARIFEQFSQADGSTTRQHGGTGLGLAISRRLVTLMGGSLKVESALGAGSTLIVELRLPLARDAALGAATGEALAGVRVLVVDDNQTNRDILLHQLQGWGMQVRCADSGVMALGLLDEACRAGRPFDLAVLDMHMPRMDGLELASVIQGHAALATTKLVMLSSTYCSVSAHERQQAGLLRFLTKPVGRTNLHRMLTETIACGALTPSQVPAQVPADPAVPRLQGHVLLVEDNPINQGVAKAMLAKMGLQVTLAEDGSQGVARVRAAHFDVVLMDCQMPVMDGFEATAAIRGLPDGRGLSLPIVALTANALEGDEQACLDAGMNAFMAKPYTLAALRTAVIRWLPQAPASTDAPAPAARQQQAEPAGTNINAKTIAALRELEEPGSSELVTQLVGSFLATADGHLARAAAALAEGNAKALSRAAHTLKSSAANLGAEALAANYGALEKCAREGRLADADGLIDAARAEQQRAMLALRGLLQVAA